MQLLIEEKWRLIYVIYLNFKVFFVNKKIIDDISTFIFFQCEVESIPVFIRKRLTHIKHTSFRTFSFLLNTEKENNFNNILKTIIEVVKNYSKTQ